MKISDIPKESRPRERFITFGPESLSDAELLAIVLRSGTINENVIDMSNRIISAYGLYNLFESSISELQKIKGIGVAKALQILSISELWKRKESFKKQTKIIKSSKDIYNLFSDKLKGKSQEYFYIVMLNTKNKVIGIKKISLGILDASIIHPREIFKPAIKNSAARLIMVHNHPSGDPTPSEEDIVITKKLIEAGNLIGIEVMDHVIIGDSNWWSYVEK